MGTRRCFAFLAVIFLVVLSTACGGGGGGGTLPPPENVPDSVKALDGHWKWVSGQHADEDALIFDNGQMVLTQDIKVVINQLGASVTWHENSVTEVSTGVFEISGCFTLTANGVSATEWDTMTMTLTGSDSATFTGTQRLYEYSTSASGTPDETINVSGSLYR